MTASTPFEFSFYDKLKGEVFRIALPDFALNLTVYEVEQYVVRDGRISFSVIFHSDRVEILPQDTYSLTHDSAGTAEIFIVPIGRGTKGIIYQAIFN